MGLTNSRSGYEASTLANALSRHTPITIPYRDPIDWAHYGTLAAGLLSAAVALRFIAPILQSRWTWAFISIGLSLIMTSGYMFVRIRGSPYTAQDGGWIAGGYQNQFGQEVSVIAFICQFLTFQTWLIQLNLLNVDGLLAFSFLMLIMVIPYQTSPNRQRLQVYLWTGVIMIVYSILVSIFRVKNRGTVSFSFRSPLHD
jgi:oligosaccharyltransferase complex subunit gamma